MRKLILFTLFAIIIGIISTKAQVPTPADPQSGPILLINGVAHLGTGQVIDQAQVAFDQGKITMVSDMRTGNVDRSQYEVIDLEGKHIYPGMILPSTIVGLEDIGAVRPTRDHTEVGEMTPHVRSLVAYNTDSEIIPTLRYNGILLVQSTPRGGIVTGTSSIMAMDGWNWEDAQYKADDGVHVNWPRKKFPARWWRGETSSRKNERYDQMRADVKAFFEDAMAYARNGQPETVNLKLEAMKPIFSGEKRLYVHADGVREILESLQLMKSLEVPKIVLVGADDAYYVRDYLKENNIPVILGDIHRLPEREEEDYDMPYKLPYLLKQEGILVALSYSRLNNSRNLPFYAGTAAAFGLSKEEALMLVTSNTAQILGIDDRTGTVEVGKDANLVITNGDMLDMRGSVVTRAYVIGKEINLDGKQQLLYKRFMEKYGQPVEE